MSRAPHGARGLKLSADHGIAHRESRAPHGARGLKPITAREAAEGMESRPARGAWIETLYHGNKICLVDVAPHTGRVD